MKAAGAGCHIGPSSFMSQSAVVNHLQGMPLSLCPMDEFGSFLKKVNSPRASTHERAVSAVLRPAWGTSFEIMMTPEWAGRKAERISTPALSILGMSTPREYYDSLKSSDIENGLTNRLLVLSINELPDEATPKFDIDQLPESLVTGLAQLFNWDQTKMGTARLLDPNLEPKPEMLTWGDGAEDFYRGFSRAARDRIRADDQYGDIHAREAEIAIRLATIRAAGFRRDRGRAVVELDDMQWGAELAFHSGEIASIGAHQHMAENEQQAHKKLLLRLIPEHCEIKRNALCRKSQELSHREREAALSDLAEAGVIDVFRSTPSAGGRPAFSYRRRARSFVK
jgi:hypothetical protein